MGNPSDVCLIISKKVRKNWTFQLYLTKAPTILKGNLPSQGHFDSFLIIPIDVIIKQSTKLFD